MKIAINYESCVNMLLFEKLHEYGMMYVGAGMIKAGDYTKGTRNYYRVFNEQLFSVAVIKFGFDYTILPE